MRNLKRWLAPALTAALFLVGVAAAAHSDDKDGPPPDKKGGPPGRFGGRGDRFGPGGGPRGFADRGRRAGFGGGIERALDELKLTDQKKEKAEAAVKAYHENVRKLADLARADLLVQMQAVLSEPELKKFKEGLDRPPGLALGGRGAGRGRGLSVDEVVERIMAFDRNKDGKVTKDELPERMQGLIARGDTNKDGALDKEEIKKLATTLARDGAPFGLGGRGGRGAGPRGFGGRGGFGGRFGPGDGPRPGVGAERALDDLKLTDQKQEKAEAAVRAHREKVRTLMGLPRAELVLKMQEVLSEPELRKFKEALDRRPGPPPAGASRPSDVERRLEQLQKDLDALRRDIRR